eukprot:g38423.t1
MGYFHVVMVFLLGVYVFETYLDTRQYRKLKEKQKPKELTYISEKEFESARLYSIDKMIFHLASSLYQQVELMAILCYNFLPWLWSFSGKLIEKIGLSGETSQSLVFLGIYTLLGTLTAMPFDLYSTFVVEAKHGFNKQTPGLFFADKAKTLLLTFVIGGPVVALILWVIEWGGAYFYIYVCGAMMAVQLVLVTIYPTLIQPMFNKVTPLRKGSLRQAIEALADKVSFPLTKLFVIDGSKRSAHSNAYFYGFWKNKRIVLYDTLIGKDAAMSEEEYAAHAKQTNSNQQRTPEDEGGEEDVCTQEEVVAILGHELGHWKKNHTLKMMAVTQLHLLVTFWCFGRVMHDPDLFQAFGFQTRATLIGLLLFVFLFSPMDHLTGFLMHILSRKFEFEADHFAVKLGYNLSLSSGLIKLQKSNKSNMNPDPLYCSYHFSHPPLVERLAHIAKLAPKCFCLVQVGIGPWALNDAKSEAPTSYRDAINTTSGFAVLISVVNTVSNLFSAAQYPQLYSQDCVLTEYRLIFNCHLLSEATVTCNAPNDSS